MRVLRNSVRSRRFVDRFSGRHVPHLPTVGVRREQRREEQLAHMDQLCADGVSFVPDSRLPPWKRHAAFLDATKEKKEAAPRIDFSGFKVRLAYQSSGTHPGFPTHFQ
jgi:hypothetical protein